MKIATMIARVLLGLIFFVFGLNGFLNFIPAPPMEGDAGTFVNLMVGSGYISVIKAIEIVGGAILLVGKKVPIGLSLLGPIIVNIVLFHGFFAPEGLPMALVITALEVFLIHRYWKSFASIFRD